MSAQPQSALPQSKAQPETQQKYSAVYIWYVVAVLMVAYIFSFIDRQIFSMVVGPLRRDLHITDTQVSYLQGLSFVIFYTFFGILIGRLVDIYSRRTIICVGMVLWSLFTTACGIAGGYWQMLTLRMGVGVGEAALSPAAYSLVTDYVPPKRLSVAISLYGAGIYIGSGLSFLLGGLIRSYAAGKGAISLPLVGQIHPWQIMFFVVGIPGILIAPLLYTIKEPKARGGSGVNRPTVPIGQVFGYIFRNCKTILLHNIGFGLLSLTAYASSAWVPEFYIRTYHWNIAKVGLIYGLLVMVLGSLGIIGAGRVADYLRARGKANANIYVGMWIGLIWLPLHFLMLLAPSPVWATIWLAPACILSAAPFGVAPAAIQQMMPANMRGQASAVYLFILNLIGLGLGPTAVAWGTQYLFHRDDALRYSMLLVFSIACVLGASLLWACMKPFLGSLDCLEQHKKQQLATGS